MKEAHKRPLTAGAVVALLSLLALWLVGRVGSTEARQLLESILPTVRFLCSTTAAGAATTLALMLTLLGFIQSHDAQFRSGFFERVQSISRYCTVCLAASILVLLMLVVPITESDKTPTVAYGALYYVILGSASLLGGLMMVIVLMVHDTTVGIVRLLHPDWESDLTHADDDDEDFAGEE